MKQQYCYSQTQMIISKYKKVSQKQQIYEGETQQTKHYTLVSMPVFQGQPGKPVQECQTILDAAVARDDWLGGGTKWNYNVQLIRT